MLSWRNNMKNIKILHVLQSNSFSGAENVVCQIIKMFEGNKKIEMAYASPNGPIKDVLQEKKIAFFPMKKLSYLELKKIIQMYKPDILHAHDVTASVKIAFFSKQAKIIHTIHGNDLRMRRLSMKSFLYYLCSKKASHIFWVSQTCLMQYKFYKKIINKSSVLQNVVDVKEVIEKSKEEPKSCHYDVVYIGRICYPKNPERLVEIMRLVVDEEKDISMAIVGEGNLEGKLKYLINEYNLENNIDLIGFIDNPFKILSSAKVMLMTSEWEGTPMVALEAIALGIPIVSTPTDGMCEIINNGKNGFLESDNKKLAKHIIQLVLDKDKWNKVSKEQKESNKKINNIERYKNKLLKEYIML